MERYIDMSYLRDGEEPTRWAFCSLGQSRRADDAPSEEQPRPTPLVDGSFYPASEFRLHARAPLPLPPYLHLSRNHFNLEWTGERRLKNAVMVLEWVPSVAKIAPLPTGAVAMTEAQKARLASALKLLDVDSTGLYERSALREALRSAEDLQLSDAELDELVEAYGAGGGAKPPSVLSYDVLHEVLTSGRYRRAESGRYFVLLSLAEAETVRAVMHMRQGRPLVDGADVALRLRCLSAHDAIFDATENFPETPRYQASVSQHVFRFFDCAMHFRPAELNVLLREIPAKPSARRLFFTVVVACRRRLRKSWQQTPLAKLFTLEDEWSLLKLRAQVTRTREAIRKRGLLLHDAFLKFDYSRTGMLSLPEVYGAFEWLRIPVTPEEVLFFVRSVSADDHVSYADFMELLCPPAEEEEGWQDLFAAEADEGGDEAAAPPGGGAPVAVKRQLSRVTPKGGGELVRLAQQRDREEAEVEAEFRRQLRLIEDARAERDKEMVVSSDFSWLRKTRLEGKPAPRHTPPVERRLLFTDTFR